MKLYEINYALENLDFVDKETGEINEEMLNNLQMAFEEKIENIACFFKNTISEATAIKNEEQALKERRMRLEKQAERLENYLDNILQGRKMKFPKAEINYRDSKRTVIDEGFIKWAMNNAENFLKYSEPTVDKTAVKEAINKGIPVQFARIEKNRNIQIK